MIIMCELCDKEIDTNIEKHKDGYDRPICDECNAIMEEQLKWRNKFFILFGVLCILLLAGCRTLSQADKDQLDREWQRHNDNPYYREK